MDVRAFTTHQPRFSLSTEARRRLSTALSAAAVPNSVIDTIEGLIRRAKMNSARNLNARHSTTKAGRKKLMRLVSLASQVEGAVADVGDEAEYFLALAMAPDMGTSYDVREPFADLFTKVHIAVDLHVAQEQHEALTPDAGAPRNRVARNLALALAPIWAEWSGRGWSHRGAWGHFVGLVFELADVDASAERMARTAAEEYRGCGEAEVTEEGM